ncbi:universal stress protein [Sphingomonas canadensis]|uniref:Universal stress protein n=1 Tax=Sphingomonas canadensis TaxID=1219257 RepID=A0ABW3H6C5_9SPHN|nr:universal stress protein [Sphingomonas canadensis]MCW3836512.1 universal stress protein [Sphingomonas canadensis]
MKNILVLVHDDQGQEARLQAALDLTRAVEGHLNCLDVSIIPMAVDDYVPVGGSALLLAEERENESKNRDKITARLEREDVPWTWSDVTGDVSEALREASALADVIVINRQFDDLPWPNMRAIAGELLAKGEAPLLAVPAEMRGVAFAGGRALVAWNGSHAAGEALQAAVPLLTLASEVTILEIDDGSIDKPATEAAQYLSRHGIEPVLRRVSSGGSSTAEALLAQVADMRPDYLVMGGYGRSRLVEALFGGVTRRMLTESPVPLFLAH